MITCRFPSSCRTSVDADRLEYVVKDDAQSNVNIQVDWALAFTLMALKLKTEMRRSFCFTVPPLQVAVGVVQQDLRPTIPKNTDLKLVELHERCWQQNPTWRPDFSEIMEMLQHMAKEAICQRFSLRYIEEFFLRP
ncbi:hypothetical protein Vadar_018267 [Vaccinium darrowii]|uniref:Uncharacterized protein n=1 Tax=Vaccinium darrowii TaxID=229202 RepID=A0ACB7Y848_9ERIC|nr:hypothetical protein Vadar_018267 [Vaccinium darrowii]